MARELRVSATIVLPEGVFDEAEALTDLRGIVDSFRDDVTAAGQNNSKMKVKVSVDVVRPRGEKEPVEKEEAAAGVGS